MTSVRSALGCALALLAMALPPTLVLAQRAAGPANESLDFGVPPTSELRLHDHSSPTPRAVPGGRTVSTAELLAALELPPAERPLLFDVLGGTGHDSIPGAIWLADAGRGGSFEDEIQEKLARTLGFVTREDRSRTIIFFCASTSCWLSYNAALRAVKLGYLQVGWYRGGIAAWLAAGGELAPPRVTWKRPER
jgi:PQQ-dependent catabolism-associated CXXCW motif protein